MSRVNPPPKLSSVDHIILEKWELRLGLSLSQGKIDDLFDDLPAASSPLRLYLLWRLIRAHMVWTFQKGQVPQVEPYLEKFPELGSFLDAVEDLKWLADKIFREHTHEFSPE